MLILPFFEERPEICPGKTLITYLDKTKNIRKDFPNLFISFRKPFNVVSPQTLSRWVKSTLALSGIDVTMFSAHSTRHAATSAAYRLGVSIDLIKQTAGWSGSSDMFAKFYNKSLPECLAKADSFANAIMQNRVTQDVG